MNKIETIAEGSFVSLHIYGGPALSALFSCVTNQNPSPSYSFWIKSLLWVAIPL